MFLLSHRSLRCIVLGLMFFLAGTASCWCDSYDPDPYDDIPPVVTVDFNYVVPSQITVRGPSIQVNAPQHIVVSAAQLQGFTAPQLFLYSGAASSLPQSPSNMLIPLRR
jgi:hypothetical protein